MLELGGSGSVLTETTGLSRTVDLTQRVERLTLGVLQQVCLALRMRQRERPLVTTHNHIRYNIYIYKTRQDKTSMKHLISTQPELDNTLHIYTPCLARFLLELDCSLKII